MLIFLKARILNFNCFVCNNRVYLVVLNLPNLNYYSSFRKDSEIRYDITLLNLQKLINSTNDRLNMLF